MRINFKTATIEPMTNWLLEKKKGNADLESLKQIFEAYEYQIEFERYGGDLPVCGISQEEAIDFFMNFEHKSFENQRLDYKKQSFLEFYNHLDEKLSLIEMFSSLSEEDVLYVEHLLEQQLPENILNEVEEFNILLVISIGNSMGWVHDNNVDFDVANLSVIEDRQSFLHLIAHEINHAFFNSFIPEELDPQHFFLINFAYEGIAVHYNNNLETIMKSKKYKDLKTFCMVEEDMKYYEKNFDSIFKMMQQDFTEAKEKSIEQVQELVQKYEQFEFANTITGENYQIKGQYPSYYMGTFLFGLIDLNFGKEKVYECLSNFDELLKTYNSLVSEEYRF